MMANDQTATQPPVPQHRVDHLFELLAEKAGGRLTSSNVFATPVEREGVTIIPVASVRLALGGGGGGESEEQGGEGGGAMGRVTPLGYIELKGGRSRFVPVVQPGRMLGFVAMTLIGAIAFAPRPTPAFGPRPSFRARRGRPAFVSSRGFGQRRSGGATMRPRLRRPPRAVRRALLLAAMKRIAQRRR
jgi:uncharacterized spore protein YtfJ